MTNRLRELLRRMLTFLDSLQSADGPPCDTLDTAEELLQDIRAELNAEREEN